MAAANGVAAADHFGRTVAAVVPAWVAPFVQSTVTEVIRTGRPATGLELEGPAVGDAADLRRWVAAYHPMELDGRRMAAVVVVDVTERRRAEEALRESERLLSGAQRMAGLGAWTFLAEPQTMLYGPELLSLMGRDPALAGVPQARDELRFAG